MVRVTNYFDTQVRVPTGGSTAEYLQHLKGDPDAYTNNLTPITHDPTARKMTDEQVISWYSKILESVRLRYRKLQRFARYVPIRYCG